MKEENIMYQTNKLINCYERDVTYHMITACGAEKPVNTDTKKIFLTNVNKKTHESIEVRAQCSGERDSAPELLNYCIWFRSAQFKLNNLLFHSLLQYLLEYQFAAPELI